MSRVLDSHTLAVFGGSFDPPHLAHLAIIQAAHATLCPDMLLLMPNYQNPLKAKPLFSATQRLALCENLLNDLSLHERARTALEDYEITKNRPVYSIESICHLLSRFAPVRVLLILGEDSFASLPRWKEADRICELVEFVIIARPIQSPIQFQSQEQIPNPTPILSLPAIPKHTNSTLGVLHSPHLAHTPQNTLPARIAARLVLPDSVSAYSSSALRALLLSGEKQQALSLCSPSVRAYLASHT